MQQTIRTKLQRNAEYHADMAEHFAKLREEREGENGNGNGKSNGNGNGNGRERATLNGNHEMAPPSAEHGSVEDLHKLIEMHQGAAEQLQELLAGEQPQNIVKERADPAIKRKTGPVIMPMRDSNRVPRPRVQ